MKAKYHPWVLFVLFFTLFQAQSFLLLIGMLLGQMYSTSPGIFDDCYNFSPERVTEWEAGWIFSGMKTLAGFITSEAAQVYSFEQEEQVKASAALASVSSPLSPLKEQKPQSQETNAEDHHGEVKIIDGSTSDNNDVESKKEEAGLKIPEYDLVTLEFLIAL